MMRTLREGCRLSSNSSGRQVQDTWSMLSLESDRDQVYPGTPCNLTNDMRV